jgi:hypothetical protein
MEKAAALVLLRWEELAGVGIGYEEPPATPMMRPGRQLANALLDVAKVERRRRIALEVSRQGPTRSTSTFSRGASRRSKRRPGPSFPPCAGAWPLPPAPGLPGAVARGVETFQPSRWLGWFARPWRGA